MIRSISIAIALLTALVGCGKSSSTAKAAKAHTSTNAPKVGGVYATKTTKGDYSISKVLAVDDSAVHLRMYSDSFPSIPAAIDTSKLKIAIGHAPFAVEGFASDSPSLIVVEKVAEAEMEGYRIYLEAMGGR